MNLHEALKSFSDWSSIHKSYVMILDEGAGTIHLSEQLASVINNLLHRLVQTKPDPVAAEEVLYFSESEWGVFVSDVFISKKNLTHESVANVPFKQLVAMQVKLPDDGHITLSFFIATMIATIMHHELTAGKVRRETEMLARRAKDIEENPSSAVPFEQVMRDLNLD